MSAQAWTAESIPDQTGRTFVVTGANSGLGLATTRQLARRGAHVVMAVRNLDRGRAAAAGITAAQPDADLEVRCLDLADLDSVAAFASAAHADGLRIDVLVNNAGVMAPPRSLSPQGHESQFAANHLGHFALTGLLLDLLQRGRDPCVVTVTSIVHHGGFIHFDDLSGAKKYARVEFYDQSKFANVLFGLELDRRLRSAGSRVTSVLAHPGVSATGLQTSGPTGWMKLAGALVHRFFAQDVEQGVLPQLYAATAAGVEGGQLYGPDGWRELRGRPTVVRPDPNAEDPTTAGRLWEVSEDLTGVSYAFPASA
ncbi:oxidoreductase [Nonomuraea sp. NPDC049750]|uniref:oxidoreductase n=1 Tax=Nonomuraea sp. NPDC049750 TaxID=3154738 RepID=UPI00340EAC91